MKRGAFIVFEGLDRCGKSTQCKLLHEAMRKLGRTTEDFVFPGKCQFSCNDCTSAKRNFAKTTDVTDRSTTIGKMINSYLQNAIEVNDETIHLLFTANRWEQSSNILQMVKKGHIIICDRYFFSGAAFSSAKGLDLDWCLSREDGLPSPDLVIFLNANVDDVASRGGFGNERYEKSDLQKKVGYGFQLIKELNRERGWGIECVDINASQSIENVHRDVLGAVENTLQRVENSNVNVFKSNQN